jgi:ABC-type polar amino acid transport system ATPase subunit
MSSLTSLDPVAPCAASAPLVRIEGLHKSYGRLDVLRGIDLDVKAGEKVSIIGPSGSGKTTMLRCINYIEKPTAGHIYLNGDLLGEKVVGDRHVELPDRALARQRAAIGMVFQRFNLFPHLTVLQNIMIGPTKVLKTPPRRATRRSTCSTRWTLPTSATATPTCCRADSSSGWRSRGRWRCSPS